MGPQHGQPSMFHQNIWRHDVCGPLMPISTAFSFSSPAIHILPHCQDDAIAAMIDELDKMY